MSVSCSCFMPIGTACLFRAHFSYKGSCSTGYLMQNINHIQIISILRRKHLNDSWSLCNLNLWINLRGNDMQLWFLMNFILWRFLVPFNSEVDVSTQIHYVFPISHYYSFSYMLKFFIYILKHVTKALRHWDATCRKS